MGDSGPLTAVALAGGVLESDFRDAGYSVVNKAYLRIGGVTMLERVLHALRGARAVGRIRCVTQPDAFAAQFGTDRSLCDEVIPPGNDLIDSLLAGFAGLPDTELVLVSATDIPLVTASALDAFCRRATAVTCDLGYGCVRKEPHVAAYPDVRHTWVRLREGTFCGAGVSVIRAGAAARIASLLRDFAAARKSPLRLASLFSPFLVVRVALGLVGIGELERRADELTGLRCRGVPCDEPELAVNVDQLEDLRATERIVRRAG
jgi:GTP:adenosylcobinamide-phosphate guanylyltransferase